MKDVIVVGSGPTGSWIGGKLADKGFDVVILEEHGEIGQPMCCAGILGADRLKEIGLDPKNWSIHDLKNGIIHSPNGKKLEISRNKTEAFSIDRSEFDRDLAERAIRKGAKIRLRSKCLDVNQEREKVSMKVENQKGSEKMESRMVIGADGTKTTVGRSLDLIKEFSPTACIQAEMVANHDENTANVFLGNDISSSFFGWVAPAGEVIRVGIGDRKGKVKKKFTRLLKSNPILPQNPHDSITRYTTGLIPSVRSRKIYDDKAILVGDAAGHVKPLTGGGLYLGLKCADIAADVVEKALEETPKEDLLSEYENRVEEKFGEEFEYGERARNVLERMEDEDIDELLDIFGRPEIRRKIVEKADFDHHSELLKELMKGSPELIKSFGTKKMIKYMSWFIRGD